MTRFVSWLLLVALVVVVVGCKKEPPPTPPPQPAWAQDSPDDEEGEPDPGENAARPRSLANEQNAWALGSDAAAKGPDAGVRSGTGNVAAASPGPTEAEAAALAEQQARAATERAVNSTLNGASPGLKACFERQGPGTTTARVSIRVHRMGYVMSSNVTGVNDAVRNCVQGILKDLKVQGVQTDSITVERSFTFTKSM